MITDQKVRGSRPFGRTNCFRKCLPNKSSFFWIYGLFIRNATGVSNEPVLLFGQRLRVYTIGCDDFRWWFRFFADGSALRHAVLDEMVHTYQRSQRRLVKRQRSRANFGNLAILAARPNRLGAVGVMMIRVQTIGVVLGSRSRMCRC